MGMCALHHISADPEPAPDTTLTSHSGGEVFAPFMLSALVNGMLTHVLAIVGQAG